MLSIPNNSFLNGWYKFLPRNVMDLTLDIKFPWSAFRGAGVLELLSLSLVDLFSEDRSISLDWSLRFVSRRRLMDASRSTGAITHAKGRLKNNATHPSLKRNRPTAPLFLPPPLPFLPWLLATVYCQFSRAKKKKKKATHADEIMRACRISKHGTFYRSGIKQGGTLCTLFAR